MIGLIIQMSRGSLHDDFFNNTFNDNKINVALAPGDGLLLEKVAYDKYNRSHFDKKSEIMI